MQEEGSLPSERSGSGVEGRSAAEVCTSEARKIRVPLVARQGRSPSGRLGYLALRGAQKDALFFGWALRACHLGMQTRKPRHLRTGVRQSQTRWKFYRTAERVVGAIPERHPTAQPLSNLTNPCATPHGRGYNRTTYLEERRKMMQAWADYLDRLKESSRIVAFPTEVRA